MPGVGDAAHALPPLVNTFQSIPFAGLILFFTLSYFARSSNLSRFVRFNIQQAILLDIVLIVRRHHLSPTYLVSPGIVGGLGDGNGVCVRIFAAKTGGHPAMQIPGFFQGASRMFPAELNAIRSNFVFYVMALTIGYSIFSNAQVRRTCTCVLRVCTVQLRARRAWVGAGSLDECVHQKQER